MTSVPKNQTYYGLNNAFCFTDESQRRITLLPEKFSETSKRQIEKLYVERVLAELNLKEANELLVRSAPKDVRRKSLYVVWR